MDALCFWMERGRGSGVCWGLGVPFDEAQTHVTHPTHPTPMNQPITPITNQSTHQCINNNNNKKSAPAGAPAGGAGGQWRPRTSKRRTPGRNTPSPPATPTPTRDPGRSRPWCCPMRCRLFDCWCCRCCCWCVAPWPGLLAGSLGWGAPVLGRVVGNKGRIQSVRRIIRRMRSQLWPCGTAGLVWLGLVCVTTES